MRNYYFILTFFSICLTSCVGCGKQGDALPGFSPTFIGDRYNQNGENPFVTVSEQPTSTFSVDADGASYANIRRFILQENQKPPIAAIRTEELINYFNLDYPFNGGEHPIALNGEVSACPWNTANKLIRIGIKGKPLTTKPPSNYVFLIDVSGSMGSSDKLGLLKQGFNLLVDQLQDSDRIAIVTYAGRAGVLLNSTPGSEKQKIKDAINSLGASGGTAGSQGIVTAYEIAQQNLIPDGNNRVILGTDGDFNIGISSQDELVKLIEEKRESGVFLTVLGVGRGNFNDGALEQIANNGNGTFEYIDNLEQLKKVFIYEVNKFFTVAKDVKVQVTFNPENVVSYRLIGYENRVLDNKDFTDDKKDAGEIGADQNITALYEIVPANNVNYRNTPTFTINFRYKHPNAETSIPLSLEIFDQGKSFEAASNYMRFTASIASFAMILSDSQYKGTSNIDQIMQDLGNINLTDQYGFKEQLKEIVLKSKQVQ